MPYTIPRTSLFILPVVLGTLVGCGSPSKQDDAPSPTLMQRDQMTQIDRWAVESPSRSSVDAAVIRQSTLYEYHFVTGMPTLTPIGRRDVVILARHYRNSEWLLRMRQGGATPALHERRRETVMALLALHSADDGVTIVDWMPGGPGVSSEDARRIREDLRRSDRSRSDGRGGDSGVGSVSDSPLEGDFR